MLGHLQPKKMDKSQLDEMDNIKQHDKPPDNRNMKIVNRGRQEI